MPLLKKQQITESGTQQTYEDGDTVTYKYDNSGALATVYDSATGITTTYYYDFAYRMMKYVESDDDGYNHSVGYTYDETNNLMSLVETINGTTHTTSYNYDDDNRVSTVTNGTTTKSYTYDAYSRISRQVVKNGSTSILTTSYTYRNPTTTTTSGQVHKLTVDAGNFDIVYTYTYDDNGNILSVNDGTYTTSYVYDTAGQLLRENNQAANKTYVWTYDNAGNILSKLTVTYTLDENIIGSNLVEYSYNTTGGWDDLLTSYGTNTSDTRIISYDGIGNPERILDSFRNVIRSYSWEHGRELASMTEGSTTWTYTYDANGMRTKKSDGTTTYEYVYNGSSLVQMTVGSNTLYFTSDTVTLNGTKYYYVKNLQGDVMAILDATGTAVVTYTYNAWGSILGMTDTSGVNLGTLNPLRYRSYVYDSESGLYYLQSRYYDPEMGRFLNADALISTGGLLGNNMFAYCGNNPIGNTDHTGEYTDGQIHDFVIEEIVKRNREKKLKYRRWDTLITYYTSWKNRWYGFCDLYDSDTGEVWELKKNTQSYSCSTEYASMQLDAYVGGWLVTDSDLDLKRGTSYIPSGHFEKVDAGGNRYMISYWDEGNGILRYQYYIVPHAATVVLLAGSCIAAIIMQRGITDEQVSTR